MLKNNLFRKSAAIACAAMMAAAFCAPVFAAPVATASAIASMPAEPWNRITLSQVEVITVIERDLYASYRITDANDRAAIVNALNAMSLTSNANVKEDMTDLKLLQIRMKDGSKQQFWCHTNVLMNEANEQLVSDQAKLKPLYTVLDRCVKNYPASAEWLGYMNPYRITTLTCLNNASGESKSIESALSAQNRDKILDIAAKLKAVKVSSVTKTDKNIIPAKTGEQIYNISLKFENGKEGYAIKIFDNATMMVVVDSIDFHLTYSVNNTDNTAWNTLLNTLKAM